MDYSRLGSVMSLVLNDNFYEKHNVRNIRNSIFCAIKHDRCFVHRVGGEIVGYCTWGFFSRDELDLDYWDGEEVFSRTYSDDLILFFPKFQCRAGRREVIRFIRDIQDYMFEHYPEVEVGEGLRVYPGGNTRDEKWYRKVA